MSAAEISKQIPIPTGWPYEKFRRTVSALLIQELQPGRPDRWYRVDRAQYSARQRESWIKIGISIQHQKTGAILNITGKPRRNGHETTLDKWTVESQTGLYWVLKGEDIRRDWARV